MQERLTGLCCQNSSVFVKGLTRLLVKSDRHYARSLHLFSVNNQFYLLIVLTLRCFPDCTRTIYFILIMHISLKRDCDQPRYLSTLFPSDGFLADADELPLEQE